MANNEVREMEGKEVSLFFVIVFYFISFSDDILISSSSSLSLSENQESE